jgi:ubiquinone/menaquinone biosynthesis C-methylase UbiE
MYITSSRKPYKGLAMEGLIASWYARNTAGSVAEQQVLAKHIVQELPASSAVLEIAPGPGYLAIELAKLGLRVTGLDISRSFVRIAKENATRAGLDIDFRLGDAAAMPFPPDSFHFIACRAAFKNFADPVRALCEMHRVLRPGGTALIVDMRSDATSAAIAAEVAKMRLRPVGAWVTRLTLSSLRKRAYSREAFAQMIALTYFGKGEINASALGLEVRLRKTPATSANAA